MFRGVENKAQVLVVELTSYRVTGIYQHEYADAKTTAPILKGTRGGLFQSHFDCPWPGSIDSWLLQIACSNVEVVL